MPRISTTGNVLTGIGGLTGNIAVNGVVPAALTTAAAGSWGWKTTVVIAGPANFGGGYQTYTYDTGSTVLTAISTGEFAEFNAGGNIFAGWKSATGVETSVGAPFGPFPTSGFGDVTETGQVVVIVDRASDSGLRVYDATGALLSSWAVILTAPSAIRARSGLCAYSDAQGWWLRYTATGALLGYAQRTDAINAMVPVVLADASILVVERSTAAAVDTLIIRSSSSSQAYQIATGANILYPDAREYTPGVVRVAYSTNTGESPAGLVLYDITMATGSAIRGTVSGGTIVWGAAAILSRVTEPTQNVGGALSGISIASLLRQPVIDERTKDKLITREWGRWANAVSRQLGQPVNLANVSGVLSPANGGSGTTTGVTEIVPMQVQFAATDRVLGRDTAGAGDGEELTASQVLDFIGATRGTLLYRGAGGWALLAPGSGGTFLMARGTGTDPTWSPLPLSGLVGEAGDEGPMGPMGGVSYTARDGSAGMTQSITTGSLVGKTMVFQDGLLVGFV